MDTWFTCKGYEGYLEVTKCGKVRSLDRYVPFRGGTKLCIGKVLVPQKDRGGYMKVSPCLNNKRVVGCVHRLVAKTFLDNFENLPEVNHKDCDKENNNVSNLEWCSRQDNQRHAKENGKYNRKSGKDSNRGKGPVEVYKDGLLIDTLYGTLDTKLKGYGSGSICAVLSGRTSTHKGCTFKRVTPQQENEGLLEVVFENSTIVKPQTLKGIQSVLGL